MKNKIGIKQFFWPLLVVGFMITLMVGVHVARFHNLEQVPPGFHVDELSAAVTVQCLEEAGVDALQNPYPLFGELGYGSPRPPTYMYPAILWVKIFGTSTASFRAFSGFLFMVMLMGLFLLSNKLFGRSASSWTLLLASLSPLMFQLSRVTMEPILAPLYMVWGLWFYFRSDAKWSFALAGACLAAAMYSYPPTRLHVPMMMPLMMLLRWQRCRRWFLWRHILLVSVMAVLLAPFVYGMSQGKYLGRFNDIGILNAAYLQSINKSLSFFDVMSVFFSNLWRHFDLDFLFFYGTGNLVYSTQFAGYFGWLGLAAFGLGFCRIGWLLMRSQPLNDESFRNLWAIVIMILAGLCGVVPSALTWQDIPHALRIIGLWPFAMLVAGVALASLMPLWRDQWLNIKVKLLSRAMAVMVFGLATLFWFKFYQHYRETYSRNAYMMFNTSSQDLAKRARTQNDWVQFIAQHVHKNFHVRYYLMNYQNLNCQTADQIWQKAYHSYRNDKKRKKQEAQLIHNR